METALRELPPTALPEGGGHRDCNRIEDAVRNAFHDMHCHLDFMANAEEVAADAAEAGSLLFANTVTPEGWLDARSRFAAYSNVTVGFGMHPWWVETDALADAAPERTSSQREMRRQLEQRSQEQPAVSDAPALRQRASVLSLLEEHDPPVVGEIGMDLGWKHLASRNAQAELFGSIAQWACRQGGKLLSIHSVKAARETLDILESAGALRNCTCVYHWFTGSSDQLKRAVDKGCFFSAGPRMLATGKGREYVKAIPAGRLLLETDAPPQAGQRYSFAEMLDELRAAADVIASIKGASALETIEQNARSLIG